MRPGLLLLAAVLLLPARGAAQFSPGDLSKAHASLEGMQSCSKCHEVGSEISGRKCRDCHGEIDAAIKRGHGMHASTGGASCVSCHKEHLGRDARTVKFDERSFDHARTGFVLADKHATAACTGCHQASNMRSPEVAELVRRTGRRSFLGLDRACAGCHRDPHRGAMGDQCARCHATAGWRPASKFDHGRTKFPLTGRHMDVECTRCHREGREVPPGSVMPSSQPFADCTPCHATPHSPSFSRDACRNCHTTDGFRLASRAGGFDHSRTAFPLRGRHATVACAACHGAARPGGKGGNLRPKHGRCADCHQDYHRGDMKAAGPADCARCHTEEGFRPSLFTAAQHGTLRFTLAGAHAALPCERCHAQDPATGRRRFVFADLRCPACHTDPHRGQFAALPGGGECTRCHSAASWKEVSYDHGATGFPLEGKHAGVRCAGCHKPEAAGLTPRFRGTSRECADCHRDVHAGQFAQGGKAACSACHRPGGWEPVLFNHDTMSGFVLTGAHKRAACRACHRLELTGGVEVVRFKGTPTRCESCHQGGTGPQ